MNQRVRLLMVVLCVGCCLFGCNKQEGASTNPASDPPSADGPSGEGLATDNGSQDSSPESLPDPSATPVDDPSKSVETTEPPPESEAPRIAELASARKHTARPSTFTAPRAALRSMHRAPRAIVPLRAPAPLAADVRVPLAEAAAPRAAVAEASPPILPRASMAAPDPVADPLHSPPAASPPQHATPETGSSGDGDSSPVVGTDGGTRPPAAKANDPALYDTVEVFYATDREPIGLHAKQPSLMWPWLTFGLAMGCYGLAWTMGGSVRGFFGLLGHLGIVSCIAVASYVAIQWQRSADLAVNNRVLYGNHRSKDAKLDLGVCEVTIPKTHQTGVVESPSLLRLEVRHDKQHHMVLNRVDRLQDDDFYQRLNHAVSTAKRPEVFVFVHGYNVEFDDAALRTAQLSFDLMYEGTPICYSWPSQGGLLKYTVDETNVVWTAPHLKQFLLDIVSHSGAQAVNLVAHSMGTRALTAALRELELELGANAQLFSKVVLAAPDVDAEVFRQLAPSIARTAQHVTLYASSNDNALIASKKVHGYPRAGESGEHLVILPEVETIDVSTIDTSLLGHSYYGSSDSIITDLYHIVIQSLPARERRWLEPRSLDGLTYWVFHKHNELHPRRAGLVAPLRPSQERPALEARAPGAFPTPQPSLAVPPTLAR